MTYPFAELEFDMPEGVKLTAKEIKQLQAAGLDGNVQVEDFQFKGAVDEEMEEMTIVGNAGKDGKPIKR